MHSFKSKVIVLRFNVIFNKKLRKMIRNTYIPNSTDELKSLEI